MIVARKSLSVLLSVVMLIALVAGTVGASGASDKKPSGAVVNLDFQQFWEVEVAPGALRALMDKFESENPGIKVRLISAPYSNTKDQVIASAATGTLSDVTALMGTWLYDLVKANAVANLSEIMQKYNYDSSQIASMVKLGGKAYMINVCYGNYSLCINDDIFKKYGIAAPPKTWDEFIAVAKKTTDPAKNIYGFCLPISLEAANGIQNDVFSWLWADGGTILKDGKPDLTNSGVKNTIQFIKSLWDQGLIAPGAMSTTEADKVAEFANGRYSMAIIAQGQIEQIRMSKPDLKFTAVGFPVPAGSKMAPGDILTCVPWGIGMSAKTKHPAEAWKLVEFIMSPKDNVTLSALPNLFPGNKKSQADTSRMSPQVKVVYDYFKNSKALMNELAGLPVSEELMRIFDEEFQACLNGSQTVDQMLQKAQDRWMKNF